MRYIDADLIKYTGQKGYWDIAYKADIDKIPTADVQKEIDYWHDRASSYEQTIVKLSNALADRREVVRCKDCKHARVHDYAPAECQYYCTLAVNYHTKDFFCALGERREYVD